MSTYKQKFNKDYKFGIDQEIKIKSIIETAFKIKVNKTNSMYNPYDYYCESNKTFYELKSRNNTYDAYPTTMLGMNKLNFRMDLLDDKKFVFLFNFTDGLYYINYEKTLFDTFEVMRGGRWDRGKEEIKDYLFIPINHLNKINP
jgi:hypothetical protein